MEVIRRSKSGRTAREKLMLTPPPKEKSGRSLRDLFRRTPGKSSSVTPDRGGGDGGEVKEGDRESEPFMWNELPQEVRFLCASFLTMKDLASVALVSKDAHRFARSDILWEPIYRRKFVELPTEDGVHLEDQFYAGYYKRLQMPEAGDQVQVLWMGSFTLVAEDVVTAYEGRAWWEAVVVRREGMKYKIHYPQWDSNLWDEWVHRDRIRWPPPADPKLVSLKKGDHVELRCESTYGRCPWLECEVDSIVGDKFTVGAVVVYGNELFSRSQIRFVSRDAKRRSSLRHKLPNCTVM